MRRASIACVVGTAAAVVAGTALGAETKIGMVGSTYAPTKVAAKVGDTLVFDNDDFTNHWVFVAAAGKAFDLGNQKPGEKRTFSIGQPGTFELECVIHEGMLTRVEVSP